MDKRTLGWLISEFGAKIVVLGVAIPAAYWAATYIHAAFERIGSLPL